MRRPVTLIVLQLLSVLPLTGLYRIAGLLAFFVGNSANQISRKTRENLQLCFAELDSKAQKQLYRESIRHNCYTLTELAAVWFWPAEKTLAEIRCAEICPEFYQSTRARILLCPHLGSWEVLAQWLGQKSQAMMLYKQRENEALDSFIIEARARTGGQPVAIDKGGLRQLLVGLKKGGTAMILPDQRPGKGKARIASHFFGHAAPTTTLIQNLCAKIECDVFIAVAFRSQPPGKFDLQISLLDEQLLGDDGLTSAGYMNEQFEQLIKKHPSQYQWGYRRFDKPTYRNAVN
ncbi:MAG: KDO2-lipid IV(A) lauroyltransferase [Planctomycetota bacterium]